MKPIGGLDDLLARATEERVFGTKMRSVIKLADGAGVKAVVDAAMGDVALVVVSNPAAINTLSSAIEATYGCRCRRTRAKGRARSSSQRANTWAP